MREPRRQRTVIMAERERRELGEEAKAAKGAPRPAIREAASVEPAPV
jgi:hypothetical protein